MKTQKLTDLDISVLKYYQNGRELSGFEGVHNNLCDVGYLDGDLELTKDGRQFIKDNPKLLKNADAYHNKMYISIK